MAAVLQLKINNYILETRISFLPSDNRKNLTWVFNVYDSYVIGYDVIHLHWWWKASSIKMAWMTPSKKKLSYLSLFIYLFHFIYWVNEECKDELQRMLDKPGNSHAVSSRNDFIAGLDWKHTTKLQENKHMCKPRGDRIILRTGKLNRSQPSADPEGRDQGVRNPLENHKLFGFL